MTLAHPKPRRSRLDRTQVDRAVELLRQTRPALLSMLGGNARTCVFCTRVAVDVLGRLGIEADPLPVHLTVCNPAMRRKLIGPSPGDSLYDVNGGGARGEPVEPACYYIGTDIPAGPNVIFNPIRSGRGWMGHLVCIVEGRLILDMTLDQVSRPEYGIRLPAAVIEPPEDDLFAFLAGTDSELSGQANGCLITYRNSGDQEFRQGEDWSRQHVRKTVVQISAGIAEALARPHQSIQWRTSPLASPMGIAQEGVRSCFDANSK